MKDFLSNNIKLLRLKSGKSQAGLGAELDKAHTSIGNWEKGISQPSLAEMKEIARIFKVDPRDLLFSDLSQDSLNAALPEISITSEPESAGYGKPAANDLTELLFELIAELRNDRTILVRTANAAVEAARAMTAIAADLKTMLKAEIVMREGLHHLTLEHLARLSNMSKDALAAEFSDKVASATGLLEQKGDQSAAGK